MANSPSKRPAGSRAEEKTAAHARRQSRQEKASRQAEAMRAAERRRKLNERLIVGGIVLALVAVIAGIFWFQQSKDAERENAAVPANVTDEFALAVGEADAPHELVIYEDFLCPICQSFELATDEVISTAVEEGRVRVKYFPIEVLGRMGDYSKRSANAFAAVLNASGPEVAREYHGLLFAEQPAESGPMPDDDWLIDLAVQAGAEEADVKDDIEDMTFELWVDNASDQASKDGVTGTPTVRVDGKDYPINQGAAALDALLN